jgi:hypothetical protein
MDRPEHTADDQFLDDAIREDELSEIRADVRHRDQDWTPSARSNPPKNDP